MITNNDEIGGFIDYGLNILFDGNKNIVLRRGEEKELPIGGVLCEFARLHPTEIKEVILQCPSFRKAYALEEMDNAFVWIEEKLVEKFSIVAGSMVAAELLNVSVAIIQNKDDVNYWSALDDYIKNDSIRDFILKETGFDDFGTEYIGQIILQAYYIFATLFAAVKISMGAFLYPDEDEKSDSRMDGVLSMFSMNMGLQKIDYRIVLYNGEFKSLFTIKSSISLFLFELAHAMEKGSYINRCKNCGEYFVPDGRCDAVYCSYPSPQDSTKQCKDIGARITRGNKEKNDLVTKEYRKVYMRLKMQVNRHPGDINVRKKFDRLTLEVKEWRKNLEIGAVNVEDFTAWLSTF